MAKIWEGGERHHEIESKGTYLMFSYIYLIAERKKPV